MAPEPLPIGDADSDIFGCPVCARPLAVGARRCQGCGTRLVLGVPSRKATLFAAAGLAAGIALSAGVAGTYALVSNVTSPGGRPGPVAGGSASPGPGATSGPDRRSVAPVSALARSALGQVVTSNSGLAASNDKLTRLIASRASSTAIAAVLRAVASDAAHASSLTRHLPTVGGGDEVARDLAAFYERVRDTARNGLRARYGDQAAYRRAASAMRSVLADLPGLDERTRALALSVGLDVPA